MGRRKSSPAFSLFSFQDIITSVTAILVLVMLMLTIELVSRKRSAAANNPDVNRRKIHKTVEQLQAVVSELNDQIQARPKQTREAAAQKLSQLLKKRDSTQQSLEETLRIHASVADLLAEVQERNKHLDSDRTALMQLTQQIQEDLEASKTLEEEIREEETRQKKRREEIQDRPRSGSELVFNEVKEPGKRAWLVELSNQGIRVVLLGSDQNRLLGAHGVHAAPWVSNLDLDRDYCLILVRPSASETVEFEVRELLDNAGIRFGVDLIGEDQVVRDGS